MSRDMVHTCPETSTLCQDDRGSPGGPHPHGAALRRDVGGAGHSRCRRAGTLWRLSPDARFQVAAPDVYRGGGAGDDAGTARRAPVGADGDCGGRGRSHCEAGARPAPAPPRKGASGRRNAGSRPSGGPGRAGERGRGGVERCRQSPPARDPPLPLAGRR